MLSEEENLSNKDSQRGTLLSDKYAPFKTVSHGPLKEILLLVFGNIFILSAISAIISSLLFSMDAYDKESATVLISYSIVFVILISIIGLDFKKYLPKLKNWTPYVVGFGIGIAIMLFDIFYIRFVNLFYTTGIGGNEEGIRRLVYKYPTAAFFILGFIGPLCEELTYRVGMFNLVKRWNRVAAYVLTGLVFGLIHIKFDGNLATEFIILPTYVAPGLLLALAYDLYDLPCSYVAHITNNLIAVIQLIIRYRS